MFEWLSVSGIRFGLDGLKTGWRFLRRNKRNLSPQEKIKLRLKWQPEFQQWWYRQVKGKLTPEIVIRDLRRLDEYPDIKPSRRTSSWFRALIMQTYERGIVISLAYGNLTEDENGKWRHTNHTFKEDGPRCVLAGFIPYDFIDNVDWDGDRYYYSPNVFCYFDGERHSPFERVMYCQMWDFDGVPQVRELGMYKDISRYSKRHGVPTFS
ncbi:hypothetical protein EHI47_23245 [Rhizobium leguminosarum]|uniref:Uncharacterized protein n=1 Tax=Rhizobium leguminosarum TaxID=384 RepID=A0A444HTE5_RHILE|nr:MULTISPECIES: hypothetical protein [Rhizobium]MBY3203477.1 hypothetical protein [Rhizobium laguerreae]RWX26603.1 hypothetical protein EHI47_23245 [Rhizobium leguminosarum]